MFTQKAFELITTTYKECMVTESYDCTRIIIMQEDKNITFDIYQDIILMYKNNEQIELHSIDELRSMLDK